MRDSLKGRRRNRRRLSLFLLPISAIAVIACSVDKQSGDATPTDSAQADSIARARQDSINRTMPGYVVDSILPVEEELRRFRAAVGGDAAKTLENGSASRDALVQRFMKSLRANDSADLRAMLLTSREFADLVYPESPYTHRPYRQAPSLVWMQIDQPSESGLTRAIRRLGGQRLRLIGSTCATKPDVQGGNRIWTDCSVRFVDTLGNTKTTKLFGSIIERERQFKFVSYVNDY
jgi:hypothetical protein